MFLPDRERALQGRLGQSDRGHLDNGIQAYRARRDCCSPVPLITTSHFVSERDSIVEGSRMLEEEEMKKEFAWRWKMENGDFGGAGLTWPVRTKLILLLSSAKEFSFFMISTRLARCTMSATFYRTLSG